MRKNFITKKVMENRFSWSITKEMLKSPHQTPFICLGPGLMLLSGPHRRAASPILTSNNKLWVSLRCQTTHNHRNERGPARRMRAPHSLKLACLVAILTVGGLFLLSSICVITCNTTSQRRTSSVLTQGAEKHSAIGTTWTCIPSCMKTYAHSSVPRSVGRSSAPKETWWTTLDVTTQSSKSRLTFWQNHSYDNFNPIIR